jgi:OmpA-OmpF porin, OOP family
MEDVMRKSQLSIAIGLALLAATAVQAQGYVGGGLGWGNVSVDCSDCDKSSTGGKLYGGYRLGNALAVEAMYVKVWRAGTLDVSPIPMTVDAELKATGYGLGVAYFMPLGSQWNAVARLGVMRNEGDVKLTASAKGMTDSVSEAKTGTFAYFGFGVGYSLTPALALTGEADFSRVKYGFEGEYEKDNVRLISIGLRYSF